MTQEAPQITETEVSQPSRFKFPTALTVLSIVLAAVWLASFVIPSGVYDLDDDGSPIPGTYHGLPSCSGAGESEVCVDKSLPEQFIKLWDAPPNGLYGIENARGFVGPEE